MNWYSFPDIMSAYRISKSTLKIKCLRGEIQYQKLVLGGRSRKYFKYIIPESELPKLEKYRIDNRIPHFSEESQPDYPEKRDMKQIVILSEMKERQEKYKKRQETYEEYMRSERWEQKRQEAIRYYGGICNFCGTAINLRVHHINYDHVGNEPMSDLMLVCDKCHEKLHEQDIKKKSEQTSQPD